MTFDCLVIGTGPSAEPVLRHLSGTDLSVCVIDGGNICSNTKLAKTDRHRPYFNFFSGVSPKLNNPLIQIERHKAGPLLNYSCQTRQKTDTKDFLYVSTLLSGGLSNFWGGGISRWPVYELTKATGIAPNDIFRSYERIEKSLNTAYSSDLSTLSSASSGLVRSSAHHSRLHFKATRFMLENSIGLASRLRRDSFDQSLIWNSGPTIRGLIRQTSNFSYIPHLKSISIGRNERDSKAWDVICFDKISGTYTKIIAKTVLLCAGTIPSAQLVYSALRLKGNIKLGLLHNQMFFLSALHKQKYQAKPFETSDEPRYSCLLLPELQWQYCINDYLVSSGYAITPSLLTNALIHSKQTWIPPVFRNSAIKLSQVLSSRITLFTGYIPCSAPDVEVNFCCANAKVENPISLVSIRQKYCNQSRHEPVIQQSEIFQLALKDLNVLPIARLKVKRGADVHYAGTLGNHSCNTSSHIHLSCIGEVEELKGVFSVDPARLNYLSSLPHTFTSMAIVDASMPYIIERVKCLIGSSSRS